MGPKPHQFRCHTCNEPGHFAADCPQKVSLQCFACHEVGHISRDCPNKGSAPQLASGRRGVMRVGEDGRIAEQADEVQTFCGKVTIVHPHCCFMESKPGHSNVFVSAYIADPSKINQGDTIEVKARWNAERSNWKAIGTATRSGAVIPPRTSDATAATGGTERADLLGRPNPPRPNLPTNGPTLPPFNWLPPKKGEGRECSSCKFLAGKNEYDDDEWKKEADVRKCGACIWTTTRAIAINCAKSIASESINSFVSSPGFKMPPGRNNECPMCSSEVGKSRDIIVKLPCEHVACEDCLRNLANHDDYALNLRNCKCPLCLVNFNNKRIFFPNAKCFDEGEPSEARRPREWRDDECGGQSSAGAGGKGGMQVPSDEQPDHPISVGDYVRIVGESPQGGTSLSDQDPWIMLQRTLMRKDGMVDQWDPEIGRYTIILDRPLGGDGGSSIQIHSVGVLPEDLVRLKKSDYGRQAVASSEDDEDDDDEDEDEEVEKEEEEVTEEEEEIEEISENPPLSGKRVIVHGVIAKPHLNGMEGVAFHYYKRNGRYAVRLDCAEGEEPLQLSLHPDNLSEVVEDPPSEASTPAVDIETASCSSSTTTVNAKQEKSDTHILSGMGLTLMHYGYPEIAVPVAAKSLEAAQCSTITSHVKGVSAARNVIAKGCLDLAVQQLELARSECSKRVPDFDEMIAAAKKSKDNAVESANAFDDQMRDELLRLTHEQDLLKLCVYRDKATEKKMEAERFLREAEENMPSKTRGSLLRENGMLRGAENKDKADAIRLREMTLQEALTAGKWKLCRNSGGHRVYERWVAKWEQVTEDSGRLYTVKDTYTLASTPSDRRATKNAIAALRRKDNDVTFKYDQKPDEVEGPSDLSAMLGMYHEAQRDLKEKELQYNASRGEVNDLERQIENLKW